ncbi:hypothetical protein GA0111570_101132 [Raineyella antarctica]|uniref:Uncharacterized protein n=1 Tax=Raineyella antarctica TaxID=1577474 RepID=A0A1G6GCZ3_9ACTN|nr:hypothetical protein [Raineyella antarctica]SDB79861.1 hypothetical protein GA0111570_101132 [Raineyella antarctica]
MSHLDLHLNGNGSLIQPHFDLANQKERVGIQQMPTLYNNINDASGGD